MADYQTKMAEQYEAMVEAAQVEQDRRLRVIGVLLRRCCGVKVAGVYVLDAGTPTRRALQRELLAYRDWLRMLVTYF